MSELRQVVVKYASAARNAHGSRAHELDSFAPIAFDECIPELHVVSAGFDAHRPKQHSRTVGAHSNKGWAADDFALIQDQAVGLVVHCQLTTFVVVGRVTTVTQEPGANQPHITAFNIDSSCAAPFHQCVV
jgi:hypothetical protein